MNLLLYTLSISTGILLVLYIVRFIYKEKLNEHLSLMKEIYLIKESNLSVKLDHYNLKKRELTLSEKKLEVERERLRDVEQQINNLYISTNQNSYAVELARVNMEEQKRSLDNVKTKILQENISLSMEKSVTYNDFKTLNLQIKTLHSKLNEVLSTLLEEDKIDEYNKIHKVYSKLIVELETMGGNNFERMSTLKFEFESTLGITPEEYRKINVQIHPKFPFSKN